MSGFTGFTGTKVRMLTLRGPRQLRPFPGGRELTEVVLVGGGTRMSAVPRCLVCLLCSYISRRSDGGSVLRLLRSLTGIEARRTIDPDEAVALGAAVQASN